MVYDERLHEIGEASAKLMTEAVAPHPFLQEIVSRYFVLRQEATASPANPWYILPDSATYLIFCLVEEGGTISPSLSLVGPRSKHKIISRQNRRFTFICSFKPGGLSALVDMPLHELRDLKVDPREVLRNYQGEGFEKLTDCAQCNDMPGFIKYLESVFRNSIVGTPRLHAAVRGFYDKLAEHDNCTAVAAVSGDLGYSDRQLRNLMMSNVGHSPKMIQQIERFTESLRLSKGGQNWTHIAHSSGYYDQSHMIADYHKLVGSTPERLLC